MKTNKLALCHLFAAVLLSPCYAHAQDHHTGGGSFTESDFQNYMNQIDSFLSTSKGVEAFPEIRFYNQTHSMSFHQLIKRVHPRIVYHKVVDGKGNDRDCLSHITAVPAYFECNANRIPTHTLANEPSLMRIVFHELLVMARLEKPNRGLVASEYPISSRITKYLTLGANWMFNEATAAVKTQFSEARVTELQQKAQGVLVRNVETDEYLALVIGTLRGGQQMQRMSGSSMQVDLKTVEKIDADSNFGIIAVNARGIKFLAGEADAIHQEDLQPSVNFFNPHRIDPKIKLVIQKALGISSTQYADAFRVLQSIISGQPGKLVEIDDVQATTVKAMFTLWSNDCESESDVREALQIPSESNE